MAGLDGFPRDAQGRLVLPVAALDRFWSKVHTGDGNGSCWPWLASVDGSGYGNFRLARGFVKSHRLAYLLMVGPIPASMELLHECDHPTCCNPSHLVVGSHADNMSERHRKGRYLPFERDAGYDLYRSQLVSQHRAEIAVSPEQRFWNKVDRSAGPSNCWPWKGKCEVQGYGSFYFEGCWRKAHRFALRFSGCPVPSTAVVLHRCDNRPCCNPAHLIVGSQSDNVRDMWRKKRDWISLGYDNAAGITVEDRARGARKRSDAMKASGTFRGERNPYAKLTDDQREEISRRRRAGERTTALAREYGISPSHVSHLGIYGP